MRWIIPVAMFAGFLSACAPGATGVQGYIDTAQAYVDIASDAADTCVRRNLPLCAGKADEIAQAKAVANEALTEARAIADNGGSVDMVRTLTRVAMNALLLFYPA